MSDTPQFPHGTMRRKDREITDRSEMESIIRAGKTMYMALAEALVPFNGNTYLPMQPCES